MKLEKGRTYYKITYADRDFTMPRVNPMVYIGKNAFVRCVENSRDTFQFQDTVSFVSYGYVMGTDSRHKEECRVEAFDEEQLGRDVTTLEGVARVVDEAISRSRKLNQPALTVAKGEWVTARSETWVEIDDEGEPAESD